MAKELVWFKKNVNYNIGVRMFRGDGDGKVLTGAEPYVEVDKDNLREFKQANKYLLTQGLLVDATEPTDDWETANNLSDDEMKELLSKVMKLNARLPQIDSLPILYKLLEAAKLKNSAQSTIEKIEDRITVVEQATGNRYIERDEMQGVE